MFVVLDAKIEETRAQFIEKIGLIAQAEGLPRIAGRMFGLLVFDGAAVSFGDLADQLQVSRASISTSARILDERGLIKRVAKPGVRQDHFQLAPNAFATMVERSQKSTKSAMEEVDDTLNSLPADAEQRARLNAFSNFYNILQCNLGNALTELQNPNSAMAPQPHDAQKDS